MSEYHKIQTVYLRDPETKFKTLLEGQYAQPEFEYLANNEWGWTEKVDGTNIRIFWNAENQDREFRGRTDNAMIPAFLFKRLEELFPIECLQAKFPDGETTLYGEGFGAKIQKGGGRYKADGVDFALFDVKVGTWWLRREDVENVADDLSLPIVPYIGEGPLHEMVEFAREGFDSEWGNFTAEGIVARPNCELVGRNGERIITKIKHKDFHSA